MKRLGMEAAVTRVSKHGVPGWEPGMGVGWGGCHVPVCLTTEPSIVAY